MFAVINISGKQYKTNKGTYLKVPKQKHDIGSKIKFENVLLISDGEKTHIGKPTINGASVTATVLGHDRYKKILIYKKKRRKGYQRKNGHRQWYTELEINEIKMTPIKKSVSKTKPKKTEKKELKKNKE